MKFIFRNIACSWILFDILRFFMEWKMALLWAIPVCLLLFTFYDDADVKRTEQKRLTPAGKLKVSQNSNTGPF